MKASTKIKDMVRDGDKIVVPTYQRAYSWETPESNKTTRVTHTDTFLADLEEYSKTEMKIPYYFGHFLFQERDEIFYIIDGQQRLTTIIIFLSVLFNKIKKINSNLERSEQILYEDIIERYESVHFSTVEYDNQLFIDYVVKNTKKDRRGVETQSSHRIIDAYEYFDNYLENKKYIYLKEILEIVTSASCTTHQVNSETEAIQMFIFQNNRGKKPSNLEVIKAQFMYNIHLKGGNKTDELVKEIKNRFEKIYKSISSIEYNVNEDDILLYTLRVYFNSLWESKPNEKITEKLAGTDSISFIIKFTQELSRSFEYITHFLKVDELKSIHIHSLVTLGNIGLAFPFIIKSYKFNLNLKDIEMLCVSLENLILRHRLIGTKAYIISRINKEFSNFIDTNPTIIPIINKINFLKIADSSSEHWWAYWNNAELEKSIQGNINHTVARYVLWKYENHLKLLSVSGYSAQRFESIVKPELEHIAPSKEPDTKPHGYSTYDDEFKNEYLNCFGNFLLLSKSYNCAVGNIVFLKKYDSYCYLEQQREIKKFVSKGCSWDKESIKNRKEKIIEFIMSNF